MAVLVVAVWILSAISIGGAGYWALFRWRVHRDGRNRPGLREGLPTQLQEWPSVSIVIPAHNEETHAPDLLRSLLAQSYAGSIEIIFVLDRCTDRTREALEQEAARSAPSALGRPVLRLVDNTECPDDWAGKCNAAHRGSALATGDVLLFTDADTTFDPSLVRAAVALLVTRDLSLLSALPAVSIRHNFESVVQPVAAMQLMKLYPIARANDHEHPRPFANGQFMLFTREGYAAVGGHVAVKDDLLEDLAFARAIVQHAKRRAGLFLADDLLRVRMYETYSQFREGWCRIFIEASRRDPAKLIRYGLECALVGAGVAVTAVASVVMGVITTARGDIPLGLAGISAGLLALVAQQWTLWRIFDLIGVPRVAALAYAYGSIEVARIQWRAARYLHMRKSVRWGGRQYILEPKSN